MTAAVETMMYSGDVPWHGFGIYVGDEDVDSKTAIIKAGLDWDAEKWRLFASKDGVNVIEIEDHKAMMRGSDEKPLGVVGNRYHPVQNKEAFEFMDSLVESGQMRYHTAGSLMGGRKIWILGKIGNTEIVPGDKVDHYLLLHNTHDGSQSLRVLFTNVRVVCANTAQAALEAGRGEGMRVRHTKNIKERIAQANEILGISTQKFTDFRNFAKVAASTQLSAQQWDDMVLKLVPDPPQDKDISKRLITIRQNTRDQLTDLYHNGVGQDIPGVAGTGWAAYNAVVEFANYHRGTRGGEKQEKRFESSLFGGSNRLIHAAVQEIRAAAQYMEENLKQKAVNYMGGKCILCSYNRCLRALHFHHINPHEKDFEISKGTSWNDIQDEIEKCALLCANCHSEVHSGMIDHELLAELVER